MKKICCTWQRRGLSQKYFLKSSMSDSRSASAGQSGWMSASELQMNEQTLCRHPRWSLIWKCQATDCPASWNDTLSAKADALCTGRMKARQQLAFSTTHQDPDAPTAKTRGRKPETSTGNTAGQTKTLFSLKNTELLLDINWEKTMLALDSYSLLKAARMSKLWQWLFLLIAVNEQ